MPASAKSKKASLNLAVPPELQHGVYATIATVQPSPWDYAITFYHTIAPPGAGQPISAVQAEAVARVVVPRSVMGSLIKALQSSMARVEEEDPQAGETE
jgi:hypothetical protein